MDWAALAGGLLGGVGSLFGDDGQRDAQLSPQALRAFRFAMRQARRLNQFSRSPALSDPGELEALSQNLAGIDADNLQQRKALMAAFTQNDAPNLGNFLTNLDSRATAQRQGARQAAVQQSLGARRQAQLQSTQIGLQAGGVASGGWIPGSAQPGDGGAGIAQLFGQLAQAYSYSQARRPRPLEQAGGAAPSAPGYMPGEIYGIDYNGPRDPYSV